MDRTEVIQQIIDKIGAQNYLEVGVSKGYNFFEVKVKNKVAVDPAFAFSGLRKFIWSIKNNSNKAAKYYELTSDDYFSTDKSSRYDVIFIDGLHTYAQTIVDVTTALERLNDGGVIVMHDCKPPHAAASFKADSYEEARDSNLDGWNGEWCGDVWKTVCHLRSTRDDLNVFVLDCDYGLGIVTKGAGMEKLGFTVEDVDKMTYSDLNGNEKELLNLTAVSSFDDFLVTLRVNRR